MKHVIALCAIVLLLSGCGGSSAYPGAQVLKDDTGINKVTTCGFWLQTMVQGEQISKMWSYSTSDTVDTVKNWYQQKASYDAAEFDSGADCQGISLTRPKGCAIPVNPCAENIFLFKQSPGTLIAVFQR